MGRPRIFTRELAQKIIDLVRHPGMQYAPAARSCGISPDLESKWRLQYPGSEMDSEGDYTWYLQEVTQAREASRQEAIEAVKKEYEIGGTETRTEYDGDGNIVREVVTKHRPDFRAATWYLENSHHMKYQPKQHTEHSGAVDVSYPVTINPGPAPQREGEEDDDDA